MNPERIERIALSLTSMPSVTNAEGETRFAFFLRDLLAEWPYFRAHPDRLRLERTVEDGNERYILFAFAGGMPADKGAVRPALEGGAKPRSIDSSGADSARANAVILTGHYDVVSAADYGSLESYAFDPKALRPRLVSELRERASMAKARGESLAATELRALRDLESGDFIPGRGLLDMKSGLAAGLALLEERTEALRDEKGALVFLAVPDEEGSSHGMLSAVRVLPELLAEWGLKAVAAINLDAAVDQGDGAAGRAIFAGSIGKLHPFVLFVGKACHAGAPFDGVNPALLAASYAQRLECTADIFEATADEPPPPPTILYYRDLRDHYDVTTPGAVFVSANLLSHERGPADALEAVSRIASEAMDSSLSLLRERAEAFSAASGIALAVPDRRPRVVPWAELERMARAADPTAFDSAKAEAAASADAIPALASLCAKAVAIAGLEGPAAVVGLAPPYYPRVALEAEKDARLLAILAREAEAIGLELGQSVCVRPFFPGISDMSFLNPSDAPEARLLASQACPLGLDPLPAGFSCPVVNIGPWGREYHQRLERVHADYAFRVLPELLRRVTRRILE